MMKLIGFELNKMLRSKKCIFVFILLLVLVSYNSLSFILRPDLSPVNCYISINSSYIKDEIDQRTQNKRYYDEERIKSCEKGLKLLEDCKDKKLLSDDYLYWSLEYFPQCINRARNDVRYETTVSKYLLEKKVAPEEYCGSANGLYLLQTITGPWLCIFLLLFSLMTADIFNKEYRSGSHKLLLTQPFKRQKFISAKYIASVIFCIGSFIAAFAPYFVISVIKYGFGPLDYPMQLSNNFLSFSAFTRSSFCNFVPAYFYFFLYFVIAFLIIAAFCAISLLLSSLFNNRGLSLSILPLLTITAFITMYYKCTLPLEPYNVFSYCNIDDVLSAYTNMGSYTAINMVTFLDAVVTSIIYTVICVTGSVVFIKHKQFDN